MSKKMRAKACWLARETKQGWRLKLCVGSKDYPVRGLLLADEKQVNRMIGKLGVVFLHMKKGG